ncbi:hypothetical protein KFE25_012093 [Diacronema lutheri]|uniref:Uncharacterized protein n=2 Tax=Diacronema lutheri TaxID=2081491 RepID=A0A8J5X9C0_DIALT|nr:hypothetical protein KFE25_012093 [Diacronema lutheri]
MSDELAKALARDVNCLAEENRNTRRRALQKLSSAVLDASPPLAPAVLLELWDGALRTPLLRALSDPVEKNREVALALVTGVVERLPDVASSLATSVPTIAARVGSAPFEEGCEEVRLQLCELSELLVRKAGAVASPLCKELCAVACALAADSFPDVKRAVCALVRALVVAIPADALGAQCPSLARALSANLGHQHAKVRATTLDALCDLLPVDDAPLVELSERLAMLAADHTPGVREQCTRRLGELLVRLRDPAVHYARLLPPLLRLLSDELPAVRALALDALGAAGERAAPGATGDLPTVAHVAPPPPPSAALPSPFDTAPAWPAVQLVQAHLPSLMGAALGGLRDWTVGGRLRYSGALLGTLWCARGAATDHLDALLAALYAAVDDDDGAVRAQVCVCARMAGAGCEPDALMTLALRHCAADGASVAHRSACLHTLTLLIAGMGPAGVGAHARALAAVLREPRFCAPPVALADDATTAHVRMQTRLAAVVSALLAAAPSACAAEPQAYQLYCALMQLAAVPAAAGGEYAAQARALAVLDEQLAPACGAAGAGAMHLRFGGRLIEQLVSAVPIGDTSDTPATRAAACAGVDARAADSAAPAPFGAWTVGTHEWHVLQAVLQHADGRFAAEQLLVVFPPLAALLEPSREPPLRLTALALIRRLLSDVTFCAHADFAEWAGHMLDALLVPNLVWRAGRAAQQVRLAAALCVRALLALEPCPVPPEHLRAAMPAALPVLRSALEDESAETRLAMCAAMARLLPWVGNSLTDEHVRSLYPDFLKRLDDANDDVRLAVCPAIEALLASAIYDAHFQKPGSNLDETNLCYLVRGVLVHLDDFSPEIQRAAQRVVRAAIRVNPAKLCAEVSAVRERHRSPKLCDALIAEARAASAVDV